MDDGHAAPQQGKQRGKRVNGQPVKRPDDLLRLLIDNSVFDLALIFTGGQYLLYQRQGQELRAKGVSAQALRQAFVQEPVDSGWLPAGVIRSGTGAAGPFVVKYIPPRVQTLSLFKAGGVTPPQLVQVPLPGLVFIGLHTTYSVWALCEETFSPSARLYHAPLPNVYADGRICFGSNRPPEVSAQTIEEAWQLFLTAPFNGDLAASRSRQHPKDVRAQLFALARKKATSYPVDDLVLATHRANVYGAQAIETVDDLVRVSLLKQDRIV